MTDARIAAVKRAIDRYNQQRNDWIEKIDEAFIELLATEGILPRAGARLNTETPGSAIDRLSIMSLRIYHFDEQLTRDDADDNHRANVAERLARCRFQHADLSQSLAELLDDIWAGRKLLKVYRQMKMYNDPTLNPYLYRTPAPRWLIRRHAPGKAGGYRFDSMTTRAYPMPNAAPRAAGDHALAHDRRRDAARPHDAPHGGPRPRRRHARQNGQPGDRGNAPPGLGTSSRRIAGKVNLAAIPILATRRTTAPRRDHSIDALHRQLVERLARTPRRPALDRPRARLHFRPVASPSIAFAGRFARRETPPRGAGHRPRAIHRLHNAISPDDFYATRDPLLVRAELGADADTPVVGTFAHLSRKKGHRDLFAAMPAVLRQLPKAQFWIVGEGKLWDELHQTAEQTGVMQNVRFLGFRRDVADLMNAIDVMALPSRREPCALVYVEAALSRKPSIGCRSGGAPESIADGETGLLVPVGDSAAIAESLLTLLTNRDCAARMGRAAYERAVGLFGWDRFIHTLERVYERVLDENPATPPHRCPFRCLAAGATQLHVFHRNTFRAATPAAARDHIAICISSESRTPVAQCPPTPLHRSPALRACLHAITPSKLAGAETFLARLLRRASLDQFVSHCVTSRSRANHELLAANMPFDRLGIGGKANLLAVPALAAAARRFQADVLHSHLSTASWWCGWLEQLGGPPSIGHVHGFTSALWHRRQSHLIACSAAVKQDLIDKGIAGRAHHRDALPGRPRRHAADALARRRPPRARRRRRYARRRHVRPPLAEKRPPRTDSGGRARAQCDCRTPNSGASAKARCEPSSNKRPASWASPTASSSSASAATWPT